MAERYKTGSLHTVLNRVFYYALLDRESYLTACQNAIKMRLQRLWMKLATLKGCDLLCRGRQIVVPYNAGIKRRACEVDFNALVMAQN